MTIDVTKFEVEKTHFWIPTYNRFNNIQTVSLLRRLGVKEDNIHVMVNEEQLESYQNKLESSKIVYPLEEQKTKNIGKIRNGIISKFSDDDLNILLDDDNNNTKLRAIELIYKLSGIIKDEKVSLNIHNTNNSQTNTKSLDDFYDDITKIE